MLYLLSCPLLLIFQVTLFFAFLASAEVNSLCLLGLFGNEIIVECGASTESFKVSCKLRD
jgi:hypothetical protein